MTWGEGAKGQGPRPSLLLAVWWALGMGPRDWGGWGALPLEGLSPLQVCVIASLECSFSSPGLTFPGVGGSARFGVC